MYTEEMLFQKMLFQKLKEVQEKIEATKQSIICNEAKISVYQEMINYIENQEKFNPTKFKIIISFNILSGLKADKPSATKLRVIIARA